MRAQAEAQAKGQQQQPQQPKQKTPKPQRQQQRQQPPASRSLGPPLAAAPPLPEIVDAELADRADRVSRLVNDDLRDAQQITEHTRRLGTEVNAADNKMQAHLHQVFDHQLGRLKSSSAETALVESERSASQLSLDLIMRLLRSPASVRDAIVMAEVLKRPDF
jgi:hypothetical protein